MLILLFKATVEAIEAKIKRQVGYITQELIIADEKRFLLYETVARFLRIHGR